MVVNDPKAVVKIDGAEVRIEALGAPITLRAGEHALEVKWGDGEFQTRRFVVRRGENEDLRVEYEPTRKNRATASREKPPEAAPKPGTGADSTVPPKQITNSIGMKLVLIPAGEFLMGSPDSDPDAQPDEKPQHPVRITRPFYLGVDEVTQGQYRAVTGANPSEFKGSDDLPVENVSWNDAIAFCDKLSVRDGLKPFDHLHAESRGTARATGCRRRRSGSMPAAQGARRGTASVTTRQGWASLPGTRAIRAARPIRWARSGRMPGACTICTATSGSGAGTGTSPNYYKEIARRRPARSLAGRGPGAPGRGLEQRPAVLPVGGPVRALAGEPGRSTWASASPEVNTSRLARTGLQRAWRSLPRRLRSPELVRIRRFRRSRSPTRSG